MVAPATARPFFVAEHQGPPDFFAASHQEKAIWSRKRHRVWPRNFAEFFMSQFCEKLAYPLHLIFAVKKP